MRIWIWVIAAGLAATGCRASEETLRFDSLSRGQREIAYSIGYGENHRIPTAMKNRFGFDVVDVRWGTMTSPRTQTAVEVSVGRAYQGADRLALSAVFSYRRYFLVRGSTAVGYDLDIGLIHMDSKVDELASRTNFTEQVGIVLQVGAGRSSAFSLEYTFRHVSNAGMELPNIGLNCSVLTAGYSIYR